jgi:hypothetical protein
LPVQRSSVTAAVPAGKGSQKTSSAKKTLLFLWLNHAEGDYAEGDY